MYPKINTMRGTLVGRRNATWEYSAMRHLLIRAIESPDVTQYEQGNAIRYYAKIPDDGFGALSRHWLRVVVKYVYPPVRDGARTGLVSTARAARARELR